MLRSLLCLALALTAPLAFAEIDQASVTIDVPAPASGFSDQKPAYLFFKQITILRKAKTAYEFHLTLQGDLPPRYDRESGIRFKTYFDFQGITVNKVEKQVGKEFADDMIISIFHNGGGLKYEVWNSAMLFNGKIVDLTITGLKVTKNEISYTVRSPIFGEEIPTKVVFSSGLLKREGKSQVNNDVGGGQDTKPTGLNEESNHFFASATPTPKPAQSPTPTPGLVPDVNALGKP